MQYLIGIDVGTSATKSVLYDPCGNVIAEKSAAYPMYQPENGWAEQDADDWWRAVCETLSAITAAVPREEIAAVGLSGQMHGLVMLDENGETIGRSILWCDGRTGDVCREIEETVGKPELIRLTGNPAITGFTLESLLWVKKHEPSRYERCRHILLPKDYIRYRLTGKIASEVSDASGTQLLDVNRRTWSEPLCKAFDIDPSILPPVYESTDAVGTVTAEASMGTGLPIGIPVAGGAADNAAAALGCGVFLEGRAFVTIGTSGVLCAHTEKPIIHEAGGVHTFCAAVPHAWIAIGSTQAAGLSLSWFRDNFMAGVSYREIDRLASEIPIGADRLLYFPALMGELTPVFDPNARGAFVGLSAKHRAENLARAVMEGVSYSIYNDFREFGNAGVRVSDLAMCGGGAKSALWKQMMADVCGVPLRTTESSECAVLGAAILAGCAGGIFRSCADGCRAMVRDREALPFDGEAHRRYMEVYRAFALLHPGLKDTFRALKAIP